MSSNQKLTNRTAESDTRNQAGNKKSKGSGLDLSPAQVVGGALAAMTAAALGSQLSVVGTVVGAALASIIAAVAGSLYTASLRRTHDKVKTVFLTGQPNEVEDPTVMEILPDSEGHIAGQRSHLVAPEPNGDPSPRRPGPKLSWKRVAVAALAAFGIAAVALTTFELVTGHALSGGEGTTIQQVSENKSTKEPDTKKKAPSKEPSAKATTAASESPTAEPSETATSEPTETTTAPTPEAQATTAPETTPSSSR
jgi:outer membrane lipoprotein SlyB